MGECKLSKHVFQSSYDMNLYADPPRRLSCQLESELTVPPNKRGAVFFSLCALRNALRTSEFCPLAVELAAAQWGKPMGSVVDNVYLALVISKDKPDESALLVFDKVTQCNGSLSIRYGVPILSRTHLELCGDGSFQLHTRQHHASLTLPSVRALWTVTSALDRAISHAANHNYYHGGPSHDWLAWYRQFYTIPTTHITPPVMVYGPPIGTLSSGISRVRSSSCLQSDFPWNCPLRERGGQSVSAASSPVVPASKKLISPQPIGCHDIFQVLALEEKELEATLRRVMMDMDLDTLTCGEVRRELEQIVNRDLTSYRKYLDAKMMAVLGQMETSSEIFDEFLYLGTEWNASNREELDELHIGYILNMAHEIEVFFPGLYTYCHVKIFDDVDVDILPYLDMAVQFIEEAKLAGSRILVHCQMGVSRSASAVIAYAMKAYGWSLDQSLAYVKKRRSCVKPNRGFIQQLKTYEDTLRHRRETVVAAPAQPINVLAS